MKNSATTFRGHFKAGVETKKKLFNNPVLEKLTHTHIVVPVSLFALYALALLYWSITRTSPAAGTRALMFAAGLVAFTWVEYNVHRYLFHISASTVRRRKFQYIVHGVHHEFPKDKVRLAMPPLLSLTVATVLLALFRLLMGDLVFSFMPGFLTGYAAYLGVHYLVHAYPPPKNFTKALWVNHAIHHYKDAGSMYGVSSPLWDHIYGTVHAKPENRVRKQ